jgi:hypothetical protein
MPFKIPFKIPFKRQYSLRNQNRWLHWLALQNLFSERSHFQIHDIQPDRLGGRFQKLMYRLLFGAIAGLLIGGCFGLLYGPIILPVSIFITPMELPPFRADWQARWDTSLLIKLPIMLQNSVITGIFVGWIALIINALRGMFDKIQWMSPLQWEIRNLLLFCLPIIVVSIVNPSLTSPGIIFSASLIFSFALTPEAARIMGDNRSNLSPQTAVFNSSYLLFLIFPALLSLVIFVVVQWHDLVFMHVVTDHISSKLPMKASAKHPWLIMMKNPIAELRFFLESMSFVLSLSLVWLLRSRPVSAAISLIQYCVMRFLIGLYGLGPFNYHAFLKSAFDQGILTHNIQGYQFVDPDDLEFYALMKFD